MISQISKWGNSQGVRISKKTLQHAGIGLNDEVEVMVRGNTLYIIPTAKKSLSWYLEGYADEPDRYDWGNTDESKGREML